MPEVRRQELEAATRIIGYDEVVMLGYRDSGMPGSEANARPDSFAQAPLEEAVGRLVAVIRRTRPQVMVIYGDEQSGYPHPDHLRVHEVGLAAFEAAGDADRFPEAGAAFQPDKLYYTMFSVARFREIHEKFEELGLESPFDAEWRKRWEKVPRGSADHLHRHLRVRRRPRSGPARPRHPGRPQVAVLVRPAARGHAHHPPPRRLSPGTGAPARRIAGSAAGRR